MRIRNSVKNWCFPIIFIRFIFELKYLHTVLYAPVHHRFILLKIKKDFVSIDNFINWPPGFIRFSSKGSLTTHLLRNNMGKVKYFSLKNPLLFGAIFIYLFILICLSTV
jgi:hypothetical protein